MPIYPKATRRVYDQFFKPHSSDNLEPDLEVHLVLEDIPLEKSYQEVFDSGQSWSMYQEEGEYHIHFDPRQNDTEPY